MNGKWVKTSMDGLGRTIKMETGYGSTTVSTVDTEYDSCACSPLGKMKRVSQPYAPNGTLYWTTYTYDGLGRTTSVSLPGNTGTTTYVYQGNTVTVTDPAGKWKKYTMDALGNLAKVTEPNPAGGADVEANYTYNLRNQLTQVSMTRSGTTQTRTFSYDLPTGRLASATNPENGTVSYTYNTDATLASKTDARNQQVQYSYDSYQRVTEIRRYSGTWPYAEDPCQRVDFYYDTNPFDSQYSQNAWGRLAATQWGGVSCTGGTWQEQYSYLAAGRATKKKLVRVGLTSLEGVWTYNTEGKMTSVQYPNGGPTFSYTFDSMGRPIKLTDNAGTPRDWVKDVAYNAAGQITGMSYVSYFDDNGSPQYFGETRTYNVRQQLTRLTTQKQWYPTTVADLEYRFSGTQNNGRITQRKDWVSGEEVTYQYDALNRLISAVTTGPEWGQSFGYDGFGNLLSQTVTKGSAPMLSINVDASTNRITTSGYSYDANGNMTAMPFVTMSYDVENRLVQATHSSNGTDNYVYDPSNRRVWKQEPSCQGCQPAERISFYGVDGTLMQAGTGPGAYDSNYTNINVYFAGKLVWREYSNGMWGGVAVDRLGSVVGDNWAAHSYFPFGEEKVTTSQNLVKFATYYRDSTTALDYANQRYYGRTFGRFVTVDRGPANPTNPQSWNRYNYANGDPVNFLDPTGLNPCSAAEGFCIDPEITFKYLELGLSPYDIIDRTYLDPPPPPPSNPCDWSYLDETQKAMLRNVNWHSMSAAQQQFAMDITLDLERLKVPVGGLTVDPNGVQIAGEQGPNGLYGQTELVLNGSTVDLTKWLNRGNGFVSNEQNPLVGPAHAGYTGNYREDTPTWSMQINTREGGAQIDIDPFNPARGLLPLAGHVVLQGIPNILSRLIQYPVDTDPFKTGRALSKYNRNVGAPCTGH